jgi:hypothetical protein
VEGSRLEHTITVTLRARKTGPPSGSGLPDTGHDAYFLKGAIPTLVFKDADGKEHPIGDKYEIVSVSTAVHPAVSDSGA